MNLCTGVGKLQSALVTHQAAESAAADNLLPAQVATYEVLTVQPPVAACELHRGFSRKLSGTCAAPERGITTPAGANSNSNDLSRAPPEADSYAVFFTELSFSGDEPLQETAAPAAAASNLDPPTGISAFAAAAAYVIKEEDRFWGGDAEAPSVRHLLKCKKN